MIPDITLASGSRIAFDQWCRRVLLPKGLSLVSSCGIVAAQLALVAFDAPAAPPPEPPSIVVSLVPIDAVRPEAVRPATLRSTAKVSTQKAPAEPASAASAEPSAAGTLAAAAAVAAPLEPDRPASPAALVEAPAVHAGPADSLAPRADEVLQRYQDLVWRMIMARRPPAVHLRGEAQIAFHLMPDGAPCDIRVARTSGDPMLDRLAMDTVRRAGPFPKPPPALQADAELKIRFQFG